jgi:hypothetical protein
MKSRTSTDVALEAAESAFADDPERAELIAKVRRFKASWFELAQGLTQARKDEAYKGWGFTNFEDYCRKELHLRRDTVDKLTGSFAFLHKRAPEVLSRDPRHNPIPTYQAVDFLRRAEEESEAPEATVSEIRRHVLEEGTDAPKLARLYRAEVFPIDAGLVLQKQRSHLSQAIAKVVELLAVAREEAWVPAPLSAEAEEPLQRIAALLERIAREKRAA